MSGIALKDLTKYHQRAMQYFKNGLVSEQNRLYASTAEAGAVSFWPLGGTPLEGKVKFSFKETPPASGDKGPENPSTISGVSSINVGLAGKNLLLYQTNTQSNNGVTGQYDSNGRFVLDGTKTNNVQNYFANTDGSSLFGAANYNPSTMRLNPQKAYTLSGRIVSGTFNHAVADSNGVRFLIGNKAAAYTAPIDLYSNRTFHSVTVPAGKLTDFIIRTNLNVDSVYSNLVIELQLEEGSAATGFESPMAPADANHAIALGSTYYGGEIDLATGLMTVTHGVKVLDGTEEWTLSSTYSDSKSFGCTWANLGISNKTSVYTSEKWVSSHFLYKEDSPTSERFAATSGKLHLRVFTSLCSDLAAFKSWLASEYSYGHPVTVAYELATPTTVQLTPLELTALAQTDKYTPRMNTVYTDADSIQISYRKSLIHDEDEKVQAITALGGNV